MLLAEGDKIGPYEIIAPLGAGGMGEVYRARDGRLARDVAIKLIRADLVDDPQRLRRFQQEARTAAAFHHPNIAVLHEIGETGGHHFIVMEYVEGRPLSQVIGGQPLSTAQFLDLATQMAEALEEARLKGVVHRDIKPSNVLVTPRGQAKILDFGLAITTLKPQPSDETATIAEPMTQPGTIMGTFPYMSPEQAVGQAADHRSDLFSLGIVLYEMGTAKRPFAGSTTMALLNEIINKTPASPVALNPAFPPALERVLQKALEKDRELRYQTAADLLFDLKRAQRTDQPQEIAPPLTAKQQQPPPAPRRDSRRILMIVTAGAAVAAAVWFGLLRDASRPATPPAALYNLTQLTRDSGLTFQPSISADGNFVVYASDRATGKDMDIWIQHVSGGQPIRLTSSPADEYFPSVSSDGRRVAFLGDGGIFVIPALGGTPKLLAPGGQDPQISPDGTSVAYGTGVYQPSEIRVVSAEGGPSRKLEVDLPWAMAPTWTHDGKSILLWAQQGPPASLDYWMVPASGGRAARTGTSESLGRAGVVSMLAMPFSWYPTPVASAGRGGLVIAARSGDGHDLWITPPSTGSSGTPMRVTAGALAANPSVAANGRIAFVRLSVNTGLWMLPLEGNTGRVRGEMRRLWRENVRVAYPNVSADGKKLAYMSNRMGDADVWVRHLETGEDRQLTTTKTDEYRAMISPDGRRVAFAVSAGEIYTVSADGGVETKVCEKCGNVMAWSPDGTKLLYGWGRPVRFATVDVATGQKQDIVWHPSADIQTARISPDGRWIVFALVTEAKRTIYVASLAGGGGGKPETWIRMSGDLRAVPAVQFFWSPDGNLLYMQSSTTLRAQRLDPVTKMPSGEAYLVHQFDGRRYLPQYSANGLTKDTLYFAMEETMGNIWLAEPSERP